MSERTALDILVERTKQNADAIDAMPAETLLRCRHCRWETTALEARLREFHAHACAVCGGILLAVGYPLRVVTSAQLKAGFRVRDGEGFRFPVDRPYRIIESRDDGTHVIEVAPRAPDEEPIDL